MNLHSVPVSSLAEVHSGGGAPQEPDAFTPTGHPFVRAGSLVTLLNGTNEESLEKLEPATAARYRLRLFPAGTVLFAKSGISATKGHIYRLRRPAYVVNHLAALVPRDPADGGFLVRALKRFPPTALIRDSAYPSIRLGDIKDLPVLAPSDSSDRKRITDVLDRAEALQTKRRAALEQLGAVGDSIFLEMFGDLIANPLNIPTASLGSLCTRITDGTHQPPAWSASGHPFLFVSNITSGEITFDTKKFISDETYAELTRRCPIEVGDVLYSTVGSYGIPAVVRSDRKFAFQRHIAHLKPDRRLLDPDFLCAMLASPPIRRQADRAARGVAQKTVNLADITKYTVFAPGMEQQKAFVARVAAIQRVEGYLRTSLYTLDTLFASLQHRAFRGEL